VLSIEPVAATVTVGARESLAVGRVEGIAPRWCGTAPQRLTGTVQVRAHGKPVPAEVEVDGERVVARLDRPIEGVAPGQALVVYDGTRVVGSATIARTAEVVRPVAAGAAR
jgi:tRNA-specific 2-thiouridylase